MHLISRTIRDDDDLEPEIASLFFRGFFEHIDALN